MMTSCGETETGASEGTADYLVKLVLLNVQIFKLRTNSMTPLYDWWCGDIGSGGYITHWIMALLLRTTISCKTTYMGQRKQMSRLLKDLIQHCMCCKTACTEFVALSSILSCFSIGLCRKKSSVTNIVYDSYTVSSQLLAKIHNLMHLTTSVVPLLTTTILSKKNKGIYWCIFMKIWQKSEEKRSKTQWLCQNANSFPGFGQQKNVMLQLVVVWKHKHWV